MSGLSPYIRHISFVFKWLILLVVPVCGLKSGNVCCHLVRNLLSSSLLSKNLKIKIYRTIILPVFYECGTWSLTLREELRLRVYENRVLS